MIEPQRVELRGVNSNKISTRGRNKKAKEKFNEQENAPFAAIPSIYLHRDAHYLAKRKVYIFNLMIPLCGSWAGFSEILIWGFLRRLVL